MGSREDVVAELAKGIPMSGPAIARSTNLNNKNVNRILWSLRNTGNAHVHSWVQERPSGPPTGLWMAGKGEDAPHPNPNFIRASDSKAKLTNYEQKKASKYRKGWDSLVCNTKGRSITSIGLYGLVRPAKPVK